MNQNHYWKKYFGEKKLIWLRKNGFKLEMIAVFLAILIWLYDKTKFPLSFGIWAPVMLFLLAWKIRSIIREDEFYNKGFIDGKEFQQKWNETGSRPYLK